MRKSATVVRHARRQTGGDEQDGCVRRQSVPLSHSIANRRHAMVRLIWLFNTLALTITARGLSANTQDRLSECAQTCQNKTLADFSCDVDLTASNPDNTTDCYCSGQSPAYHGLRSCIQNACTLEETLQWQKTRAQTCHIQPRDIRRTLLVTCCVLTALSSISCVGRLMSRSRYFGGPGYWWDDWVLVILWILSFEMIVDAALNHRWRAGVDVIAATTENIHGVLLSCFLREPFYLVGTYGAKVVFALFYLRIYKTPGGIRRACYFTIFLGCLGMFVFSTASGFVRWPLDYYYDDSARVRRYHDSWINIEAAVFAFSALNIWADCYVLLLPVPMLRKLRGLPRHRKIGITVVFLVGFVATAASAVRLATIPPLANSLNVTWDFAIFMLACQVELNLAMICVNVPTWTGLVRRTYLRYWKGMRTTIIGDTTSYDFSTITDQLSSPQSAIDASEKRPHPPSVIRENISDRRDSPPRGT